MPVRFRVIRRAVRMPVDADNGQNDDRRRLVGLGATEAHNPPFVRKFYDVTHQPLPLTAGTDPSTQSAHTGVIAD
jgi:hypothetical protein